jgi:hypothetical protein
MICAYWKPPTFGAFEKLNWFGEAHHRVIGELLAVVPHLVAGHVERAPVVRRVFLSFGDRKDGDEGLCRCRREENEDEVLSVGVVDDLGIEGLCGAGQRGVEVLQEPRRVQRGTGAIVERHPDVHCREVIVHTQGTGGIAGRHDLLIGNAVEGGHHHDRCERPPGRTARSRDASAVPAVVAPRSDEPWDLRAGCSTARRRAPDPGDADLRSCLPFAGRRSSGQRWHRQSQRDGQCSEPPDEATAHRDNLPDPVRRPPAA